MTLLQRRQFLIASSTLIAAGATAPKVFAQAKATQTPFPSVAASSDEQAWASIHDLYDVDRSIANLENGYWGIMARPVLEDYLENTRRVNRENTIYARSTFGKDFEGVRNVVAQAVGADPEEIALTRGATEALQILIAGYNKLEAGDTVLYADLDYDSMQYAMASLEKRRGVNVKTFDIPEPATRENVLNTYRKVLEETPKAKLLLLTHISHRTGLVMPISEIADMARAKGVDVIVDAAHSWGQMDFNVRDLKSDFVGFNLHKWIGAPVGMGFFYIAKNRLADIDTYLGDKDWPQDDIRARVHTGTTNFAAALSVPAAIRLHQQITASAKQARLTYLRNYWVEKLRGTEGIEILTPDDDTMHAGITSFRFAGKTSKQDNDAIVATLRDTHKVLTTRRAGVSKGQCIRVSPALYTTKAEMDQLVTALKTMLA